MNKLGEAAMLTGALCILIGIYDDSVDDARRHALDATAITKSATK